MCGAIARMCTGSVWFAGLHVDTTSVFTCAGNSNQLRPSPWIAAMFDVALLVRHSSTPVVSLSTFLLVAL
jgi:hypothetical protein